MSHAANNALATLLAAAFPSTEPATATATNPSSPTTYLPDTTSSLHPLTRSTTSSALNQNLASISTTAASVDLFRALAETIHHNNNNHHRHTPTTGQLSSPRTTTTTTSYSHTLELLAAQPDLFAGLAVAPPSPSTTQAHHRPSTSTATTSHHHPSLSYTPLPTRSGRVPHVSQPYNASTAANGTTIAGETDRETMLFNDYFDWPSSDDEDDPDFQPGLHSNSHHWNDFLGRRNDDDSLPGTSNVPSSSGLTGNGRLFSPEEEEEDDEDESDFSAVDETFTPGEGLFDVDFGPLTNASGGTMNQIDQVASGRGSRSRAAAASKVHQLIPSTIESTSARRTTTNPSTNTTLTPALPPARSKRATPVTRLEPALATSSSSPVQPLPIRTSPRKRARTDLSPSREEEPIASTSRLPSSSSSTALTATKPSTIKGVMQQVGAAKVKKSVGLGPAPQPKKRVPKPRKKSIRTVQQDVDQKKKEKREDVTPVSDQHFQFLPHPDESILIDSEAKVVAVEKKRKNLTSSEKLEIRRERNRRAAKESRIKSIQERAEKEKRLEFLEAEYTRLKRRVRELEGRLGIDEEVRDVEMIVDDEEGSVVDSLVDSDEESARARHDDDDEDDEDDEDDVDEEDEGQERGRGDAKGFDLTQLTQSQLSQLSKLLATATHASSGGAGHPSPPKKGRKSGG